MRGVRWGACAALAVLTVTVAACGGTTSGLSPSATKHRGSTTTTFSAASTTAPHTTSVPTTSATTLPPTTTALPPTTTTTSATTLPVGLGVTASTVQEFFNSQKVPIQWTSGQPSSYGTKLLGTTSRGDCAIELDGPPQDLREIEVTCSTAHITTTTGQSYAFMQNAVWKYVSSKAENWFTTALNNATEIKSTGSYPKVKTVRTITGKTIELLSQTTLKFIGVYITATGVSAT